jgi:hypothetical protein
MLDALVDARNVHFQLAPAVKAGRGALFQLAAGRLAPQQTLQLHLYLFEFRLFRLELEIIIVEEVFELVIGVFVERSLAFVVAHG